MAKAYIKAISIGLPDAVLSNTEIESDFPDWTADKILNKIGIAERRVVSDDQCASDLAFIAAQKMFSEHKINASDIDFTILCTQSPDFILPTTACILQDRLNIPTNSGAIDINLGCSGYVYGLAIAKGLVVSGVSKNVLLLTAETYTKHIHPKDKGNKTIFGDGASATLVSETGLAEIGNFSLGTDGSGANNLIIKSGASRFPDKINDADNDEAGNLMSSDHLFMNGSEIFNFTLAKVPELVEETLRKNNIEKSDVDLFVFHQANKYLMNFLRKKIKIDEEKFYYCMEKYGNTVSSTVPIALYNSMKENRLKGTLLLAGYGVGYSWAGVTLFA